MQTDEALVRAWRAGDADAGAELFARHFEAVARYFHARVSSHGEDLIQATFLACIESVEGYRGEAKFRSYLLAIAQNKLLRHLRDLARDQRRADRGHAPERAPSAISVLGAKRDHELLVDALQRLPAQTRLMLELHYWDGVKIKDIAATLKLPLSTVKTRMHRGRAQLGRELERLRESSRPSP